MSEARYLVGDVFAMLATLSDDSVDLVMSSPPFLALRSYLPSDHPDKGKEIGSEATPADFLDTLLDVVEALDRVIAPHGSLVFELGDTYSGAGGYGNPDSPNPAYGDSRFGERWEGRTRKRFKKKDDGWPLDKSLCGIPTLFAWSLAYGRNLLRPERTTPQWRIRNVIVWCRPNPPVGALGDKVRPATSYLTVATKARDRYFDLDAVRSPARADKIPPADGWSDSGQHPSSLEQGRERFAKRLDTHGGMAPPLDYWVIPTQSYDGSHYATYPEKLCEIPIKAMCPSYVCRTCGQPSRRIVAPTAEYAARPNAGRDFRMDTSETGRRETGLNGPRNSDRPTAAFDTLGWTDCGHDNWRTGVVLDPFGGSGTTLAVATGHGRDAIGIDIDARNADLALQRVGPLLLTIDKPTQPMSPKGDDDRQ